MDYKFKLLISFFIACVILIIISFSKNDYYAGIPAFAAALVALQFIFNSYENRLAYIIDTSLSERRFGSYNTDVKIINNGGKELYLDSGGIITDNDIYINFDENPDPQNSAWSMRNPVFPISINPGQSKEISLSNSDIRKLLEIKGWQFQDQFVYKGIFIDQSGNRLPEKAFKKQLSEEYFRPKKRD